MPPVIGLLSPVMALEKLQPPGDGLKIQAELSAVFPFLDAPQSAHAEHQVLPGLFRRGDGLNLLQLGRAGGDGLEVSLQVPGIGIALTAEIGVCPRAEAQVLPACPLL